MTTQRVYKKTKAPVVETVLRESPSLSTRAVQLEVRRRSGLKVSASLVCSTRKRLGIPGPGQPEQFRSGGRGVRKQVLALLREYPHADKHFLMERTGCSDSYARAILKSANRHRPKQDLLPFTPLRENGHGVKDLVTRVLDTFAPDKASRVIAEILKP